MQTCLISGDFRDADDDDDDDGADDDDDHDRDHDDDFYDNVCVVCFGCVVPCFCSVYFCCSFMCKHASYLVNGDANDDDNDDDGDGDDDDDDDDAFLTH